MYQSPATGVRAKSIITRRILPGRGKITKKFHEGVSTCVSCNLYLSYEPYDYNRRSLGIRRNSRQNIYYIFETRRATDRSRVLALEQ